MNMFFTLAIIADSSISGAAIFAISLILALIVLVVSIWLYRKNLKFRRVAMSRGIVKRCPNCNAVMQPDASFCPNCGGQVPEVTTIPQ